MTLTPHNSGWIEVICGSMFSGKTEELIRRLRRAQYAKVSTSIFKPRLDQRYSNNQIVSHNNMKMDSYVVKSASEILEISKNTEVVGIDEAQFFDDELVSVSKALANDKKRVIISGLDTDFRGAPFGPMPSLMCEADYLDKLRAICMVCGNPASCTQRKTKQRKQIIVGEIDIYEARCRNCFQPPAD